MNKQNIKIIFASIGIVLTLLFMATATYAYFSLNVVGEGNKIDVSTFNGNMQITYVDTSNVSLVNAYTGESITKTFTVKNTGNVRVYYDVILENLVNNFTNPDDLVFTLTGSNNGAVVSETTIPTITDSSLASNIGIDPGVTQSYVMIITFLRTEEDQSSNMNKTFSSKINVVPSKDSIGGVKTYSSDMLSSKIMDSTNPVSMLLNEEIPANGIFYTNNSINGSTIYYYKGDNTINNNLIFAGFCWKIVRTTENNGIRIIYNGIAENNACQNLTGTDNMLSETSKYNNNANYNAYVGYMYGTASSSTYEAEHSNTNSSVIKSALENWYVTNLSDFSSYIDDSIYCNNRKTSKFVIDGVAYGINGYANSNTGYISKKNIINNKPSYDCKNKNDKLSVANELGVSVLSSPIGLLTADEAMFAGLLETGNNTSNYLYNASSYWTMTPAYFNGSNAYNYVVDNGKVTTSVVNGSKGVRPVITLKSNIKVLSGDGTLEAPYLINK